MGRLVDQPNTCLVEYSLCTTKPLHAGNRTEQRKTQITKGFHEAVVNSIRQFLTQSHPVQSLQMAGTLM